MNLYQFMSEHPFLTFFFGLLFLEAFLYPFKVINRWIRHRNIVAQGWPPPYLDADGDFREKENQPAEGGR